MEIPGGELAELPELIRGHPSPGGFDLTAAAVGTVALDAIVTGQRLRPGDALIGLPSPACTPTASPWPGALCCKTAASASSDARPSWAARSVADVLLEPTVIYVRAILELLRSGVPVHGLAHITGDGLDNLLRLDPDVGFDVADPLPVPPVFGLIAERGGVAEAEMWQVFNMGCGFCAIVPADRALEVTTRLAAHHPGASRIGTVTGEAGRISRG